MAAKTFWVLIGRRDSGIAGKVLYFNKRMAAYTSYEAARAFAWQKAKAEGLTSSLYIPDRREEELTANYEVVS